MRLSKSLNLGKSRHTMAGVTELNKIEAEARQILTQWDLPEGTNLCQINLSENTTFLIELSDGTRFILRAHRMGYHSDQAILSELAWMDALGKDLGLSLAKPILGRDGAYLQFKSQASRRFVLFSYLEGQAPDEKGDLISGFEELGQIAAQFHSHVETWKPPADFERKAWDEDAILGEQPIWGDWRNGPNLKPEEIEILERAENKLRDRLMAFGKSKERFGLIHADMRFANLLVNGRDIHVIDFDDSGFGWFMYDFAAAISFNETHSNVSAWKAAWLRGYRKAREISDEEIAEIDSFIMLRRFALLAWIGSHMEAPEPQALAPDFAKYTAKLGAAYLNDV